MKSLLSQAWFVLAPRQQDGAPIDAINRAIGTALTAARKSKGTPRHAVASAIVQELTEARRCYQRQQPRRARYAIVMATLAATAFSTSAQSADLERAQFMHWQAMDCALAVDASTLESWIASDDNAKHYRETYREKHLANFKARTVDERKQQCRLVKSFLRREGKAHGLDLGACMIWGRSAKIEKTMASGARNDKQSAHLIHWQDGQMPIYSFVLTPRGASPCDGAQSSETLAAESE